ncbi:MAG: hypothetical protein ACKOYJ_11140 [Planctomycetia bacterium]
MATAPGPATHGEVLANFDAPVHATSGGRGDGEKTSHLLHELIVHAGLHAESHEPGIERSTERRLVALMVADVHGDESRREFDPLRFPRDSGPEE